MTVNNTNTKVLFHHSTGSNAVICIQQIHNYFNNHCIRLQSTDKNQDSDIEISQVT